MISEFGIFVREIREKHGDSLRSMAKRLDVSAAFLSAMEVGKRTIPLEYGSKIASLYHLSYDETIALINSIYKTNNKVTIEFHKMNEEQKDISLLFARKIANADGELIERLKEALKEDEQSMEK